MIDNSARERGRKATEMSSDFQTLAEGRRRRSRDDIIRQTVANGGSGDREGPAADGRQFDGRHQ